MLFRLFCGCLWDSMRDMRSTKGREALMFVMAFGILIGFSVCAKRDHESLQAATTPVLLIKASNARSAFNPGRPREPAGWDKKRTTTTTTTAVMTTTASTTSTPPMTTAAISTTTSMPTPGTTASVPHGNVTADLAVGNYTVHKAGGGLCVMAQMALRVRVVYKTIHNNKSEGIFTVPPNRTFTTGSCSESSATLNLRFKEGVVSFHFRKNATERTVYVSTVSFEVTYPFKKAESEVTYWAKNESLQLFGVSLGHSYACQNQSVPMGPGLHLDMYRLQMQALGFSGNDFGPVEYCPADQPDHSIAVGVGVGLLAVVASVVAAYAICKKKRVDGYQPL